MMKRRVVNNGDTSSESGLAPVGSQTTAAATNRNNPTMKNGSSSTKIIVPILFIIIGALFGFIIYQNQQFQVESMRLLKDKDSQWSAREETLLLTLNQKEDENQMKEQIMRRELDDMKRKNHNLEDDVKKSEEKILELEDKLENIGDDGELVQKLKHDNGVVQTQLEHLRQEIQRHDKHSVLDKFGEGPHLVEFKLDFPPDEVPEGTEDTFIIEMAPLDLVSLYIFSPTYYTYILFIVD